MLKTTAKICLTICLSSASFAATLEQSMAKLAPEERSHQACALKALQVLSRDPRYPRADSLKSSIFRPAVLTKTTLVATGGALRAGKRWFTISYSCELTPDYMKAVSFKFTPGQEIPKADWEKIGLW